MKASRESRILARTPGQVHMPHMLQSSTSLRNSSEVILWPSWVSRS